MEHIQPSQADLYLQRFKPNPQAASLSSWLFLLPTNPAAPDRVPRGWAVILSIIHTHTEKRLKKEQRSHNDTWRSLQESRDSNGMRFCYRFYMHAYCSMVERSVCQGRSSISGNSQQSYLYPQHKEKLAHINCIIYCSLDKNA